MRKSLWLGAMLAVVALGVPVLSACASAEKSRSEMKTVSHVDVDRYLGTWYEIARFPNRFQKGCDQATANYSLQSAEKLRVVNTCVGLDDGKLQKVDGEARISDRQTQAKLKVTFLPKWLRFLNIGVANYWIIDLDADYRWAVVSEPSREYMWILSREPRMARDVYEGILKRARDQELDVARLVPSRPGSVID